jgi:hypothetical protein
MTDHYHYIILRVTSSEHPPDEPDPLDARVELLSGGQVLGNVEVVQTICGERHPAILILTRSGLWTAPRCPLAAPR